MSAGKRLDAALKTLPLAGGTPPDAATPLPGEPLDGAHPVPFLKPPYGRPKEAGAEAVSRVRDRLDSPRVRAALSRISGDTPLPKRTFDIIGSGLLIAMLSPLLLTVAALIKLNDGGPVLFWQKRVGRRGRVFWFPKYRSMMTNADRLVRILGDRNQHAAKVPHGGVPKGDVTFKMKNDPRVTWIGRIIRKFSIDELPQLWCVFRGDMSLVGPRPAIPSEVARYSPADRRRLEVTPGLTCIWQVSGRGDIPFPQQVEMDVRYIDTQSFWLDLKLVALTIPAVLRGRGAY